MSQKLVSLNFTADDLATIDAAIATLEEKFAALIDLSVDDRRGLTKMGDKSERLCRQTLMVLAQDVDSLPPRYDLAEAQRDLAVLDLLRLRFSRLRPRDAPARLTLVRPGLVARQRRLSGWPTGVRGASSSLRTTKSSRRARASSLRATKSLREESPFDVPNDGIAAQSDDFIVVTDDAAVPNDDLVLGKRVLRLPERRCRHPEVRRRS